MLDYECKGFIYKSVKDNNTLINYNKYNIFNLEFYNIENLVKKNIDPVTNKILTAEPNTGNVNIHIKNGKDLLINFLNSIKQKLKELMDLFLTFNDRLLVLYKNPENKKNLFKGQLDFQNLINLSLPNLNSTKDTWSFYDINMRFYNHIIREWTTSTYNDDNKQTLNVIKNLLSYNQFNNETINKIMENENVNKDFMKEQLYNNENSFKLGWDYYKNIDSKIDDYISEMQKIIDLLDDHVLETLGFII